MFKTSIENIKRKIQERKAYHKEMSKEYPASNVFWGTCDKIETKYGVTYNYKHHECFFVDDVSQPNYIIRLTGENAERENKVLKHETFVVPMNWGEYKMVKVTDNKNCYQIILTDAKKFSLFEEPLILETIINKTNNLNRGLQNRARQTAMDEQNAENLFF